MITAGCAFASNVAPPSVTMEAVGLRKSYGATVALEGASIELHPGQVHALLGENGAGKSTLVRILTGAVRADAGQMHILNAAYAPGSIVDARLGGVATAFQELSLVPNLSVAQNLLLPVLPRHANGLLSTRQIALQGADILRRHGLSRINASAEVGSLPLAERQRIEIVRALVNARSVLILDEPTASLAETDWIFEQVRGATARGVAVLYISHRLAEVREICTKATVLRNGSTIASVDLAEATDGDIFEMMVGRKVQGTTGRSAAKASSNIAPRLSVSALAGKGLKDVSFDLHPGEILAVAALEGQGQRGLFRMLAGLDRAQSGKISLDGREGAPRTPRQALRMGSGIAYLPEERKTEGILAGLSAATNVVLPVMSKVARGGFTTGGLEMAAARRSADRVEMSTRYLSFAIGDLSGGNQQKALMARTLATEAKTLLLFDPTRGVDVGTKESIYSAIRQFATDGGSVLFYSSELPEVVQLAHRCMVLYGGRVFNSFEGDEINEQTLVAAMLGHVRERGQVHG